MLSVQRSLDAMKPKNQLVQYLMSQNVFSYLLEHQLTRDKSCRFFKSKWYGQTTRPFMEGVLIIYTFKF